MNILEFRKNNPAYDDMTDYALGRALHQKFYADMPYASFAEKFLSPVEDINREDLGTEADDPGVWGAVQRVAQKAIPTVQEFGATMAQGAMNSLSSLGRGDFLSNMPSESNENPVAEGMQSAAGSMGEKAQQAHAEVEDINRWKPVRLQERVWDNPGVMKNPEWWVEGMGDAAVSLVPTVGAHMLSGGSNLVGGAVGGAMEGTSLYNDLIADGVDAGRAKIAATGYGVVSAALNSLGLESVFGKEAGKNILSRIAKGMVGEGVTEYLEEPASAVFESLARGENSQQAQERFLDSLKNVESGIFGGLLGGGLSAAPGRTMRDVPLPDANGGPVPDADTQQSSRVSQEATAGRISDVLPDGMDEQPMADDGTQQPQQNEERQTSLSPALRNGVNALLREEPLGVSLSTLRSQAAPQAGEQQPIGISSAQGNLPQGSGDIPMGAERGGQVIAPPTEFSGRQPLATPYPEHSLLQETIPAGGETTMPWGGSRSQLAYGAPEFHGGVQGAMPPPATLRQNNISPTPAPTQAMPVAPPGLPVQPQPPDSGVPQTAQDTPSADAGENAGPQSAPVASRLSSTVAALRETLGTQTGETARAAREMYAGNREKILKSLGKMRRNELIATLPEEERNGIMPNTKKADIADRVMQGLDTAIAMGSGMPQEKAVEGKITQHKQGVATEQNAPQNGPQEQETLPAGVKRLSRETLSVDSDMVSSEMESTMREAGARFNPSKGWWAFPEKRLGRVREALGMDDEVVDIALSQDKQKQKENGHGQEVQAEAASPPVDSVVNTPVVESIKQEANNAEERNDARRGVGTQAADNQRGLWPHDGGQSVEPADRATDRGEPGRGGGKPAAEGKTRTSIAIPNRDNIDADFAVMEADAVLTSHLPSSGFQKNSAYGLENERRYHAEPASQDKVRRNALKLDPERLHYAPDANQGAPVVDQDGNVIGGNGRAMSISYAYDSFKDRGDAYRAMIHDKAEHLGLDPTVIDGMKRPVLVRKLRDQLSMDDRQQLVTAMNDDFTDRREARAEGKSRGDRFKKLTLNALGNGLRDADSLREYFDDSRSLVVVDMLLSDGVIQASERNALIGSDGLLNPDGKKVVEQALRGRIARDYDTLASLPADVLGKLDAAIPYILSVETVGTPWDITEHVRDAVVLLAQYKRSSSRNPEIFLHQIDMLKGKAPSQSATPQALAIFRFALDMKKRDFVKAFAKYAIQADISPENGGMGIGMGQKEAFDEVFGSETAKLGKDANKSESPPKKNKDATLPQPEKEQAKDSIRVKGIALSSMQKDEQRSDDTPDTDTRQRVRASDLRRMVDRIAETSPQAAPVEPVQSFGDLPEHIRRQYADMDTRLEGAYDPRSGTIYLVADNLGDIGRAGDVWAHEQLGHHGVRSILSPAELRQTMRQLFIVGGGMGNPGIADIARRYSLDPRNDARARTLVMEEYVAKLAEKKGAGPLSAKEQSVWRRFVDAVMKAWHAIVRTVTGRPSTMGRSELDAMAEDLLASSQSYLRGETIPGNTPEGAQPAFASVDSNASSVVTGREAVDSDAPLASLRDAFNAEPALKEFVRKGDMSLFERMTSLPHWIAKRYPKFHAIYTRQLQRREERQRRLLDTLDTVPGLFGSKPLNKKQMAELADFLNRWNGINPKELKTVDKFIDAKDENGDAMPLDDTGRNQLEIDPEYVRAYDEWLQSETDGMDGKVRQTIRDIRAALDKTWLETYNTMAAMPGIDKNAIEQARNEFGHQHNYFPMHRYGDWYLHGWKEETDKSGKAHNRTVYREHFDAPMGRRQAKKIAERRMRELLKEYPDARWGWGKVEKPLSEELYGMPADSDVMMQIIKAAAKRTGDKETAKKIEDALAGAVADVKSLRGWGAHRIGRKAIPGYETQNVGRVLYDYLAGQNGWSTKLEASRDFTEMLGRIDAGKDRQLWDYSKTYVLDMLRNSDRIDRITGNMKALAFMWFLGGNLKTAAVNLTQNMIWGWPLLSRDAKGATGWEMLKGAQAVLHKAVWSSRSKYTAGKGLSEDEARMLNDLYAEDVLTEGYLKDLRGRVSGKWSSAGQSVLRSMGYFMGVAERFNRASMALAAFRIARSGKLNDAARKRCNIEGDFSYRQAKEYASGVVLDAHFVYGKENQPEAIRHGSAGRMLSTMYTFRSFSHNYLSGLRDVLRQDGIRGMIPLTKSIGMLLAIGGVTSFPFYAGVMALFQAMTGDDDDWTEEIRKAVGGENWQRDLICYGFPSLAGVSLGGSMRIEAPGAKRIKPGTTPKEVLTESLGDIIGIPYAGVEIISRTMEAASGGDPYRAMEEAMPTAIKNAMAAYRLHSEGQTSFKGKPISKPGSNEARKLNTMEAVGKMFGFQPVSNTKSFDAHRAQQHRDLTRSEQADRIATLYFRGRKDNDSAATAKGKEMLTAWNRRMREENKPDMILYARDIERRVKARGASGRPKTQAARMKAAAKQRNFENIWD